MGGIQAQGLRPVYDRAKLPLSYLLVRPSLLRDVTLRALGLKYLCTLLRVALGRVRKRRHRSVTFDLNPLGFFLRKNRFFPHRFFFCSPREREVRRSGTATTTHSSQPVTCEFKHPAKGASSSGEAGSTRERDGGSGGRWRRPHDGAPPRAMNSRSPECNCVRRSQSRSLPSDSALLLSTSGICVARSIDREGGADFSEISE